MALKILVSNECIDGHEDDEKGSVRPCVLYCSDSMRALPWIFEDVSDAELFVERHGDIRRIGSDKQQQLFDGFYQDKRKAQKKRRLAYSILPYGFPDREKSAVLGFAKDFNRERAMLVHALLKSQAAPEDWQPTKRYPVERTMRYYVEWCRAWGNETRRRHADEIIISQLPQREL